MTDGADRYCLDDESGQQNLAVEAEPEGTILLVAGERSNSGPVSVLRQSHGASKGIGAEVCPGIIWQGAPTTFCCQRRKRPADSFRVAGSGQIASCVTCSLLMRSTTSINFLPGGISRPRSKVISAAAVRFGFLTQPLTTRKAPLSSNSNKIRLTLVSLSWP